MKHLMSFLGFINLINNFYSRLSLCALFLISVATIFFLSLPINALEKEPNPIHVKKARHNQPTDEEIKNWNLFGPFHASEYNKNTSISLKETNMEIKLLATFSNSNPRKSSAIFSINGKTASVPIGAPIKKSIILEAILPNQVIVRSSGVWSLIKFSTEKDFTESSIDSKSRSEPLLKSLSKYENSALKFGLKPVERGENKGYIVFTENNLLSKYGLIVGDVIVSVNGYPIGTESADLLAIKSVKESRTTSLLMKRDGKNITLSHTKGDN